MSRRAPKSLSDMRRDSERSFPKCPCGNVAGVNQTHCRACRDAIERDTEATNRFDEMEDLKARVEELELEVATIVEQRDDLAAELEEVKLERDTLDAEISERDADAFNVLRAVRDWFDNVILLGRPMQDPRAVWKQVERALLCE